jgi:hypothetical protein
MPDAEGFAWLEKELCVRGFRSISDWQFVENFHRLHLQAPRPRPGRETGFIFSANGLDVWVWTTWLRAQGKAREVDMGWVVIAKGDEALYFAKPVNRTKNFFLTLFRRAWIAQWRVAHRPHCQECNSLMEIARGDGLKERYWRCDLIERHPSGRLRWRKWDVTLPPKAQKLVDAWRASYARFAAQQLNQGKEPHAAMLKRKPW